MLCSICQTENLDNTNICINCGLSFLDSISLLHLPPDSLLKNGQYKIKSLLGQGGFGITYKGIYTPNGAEVAIKELWPQGARQGTKVSWPPTIKPKEKTEQITSFIKEADNQYQCKHPNIAAVYDWFEENNTAYIVLQFVAGKSLYQIFQDENILSEARVKKYFLQIAQALKVIHAQNFQHRDIKPDNILIDGNDQAILIDFGAAREFIAGQTKKLTRILTPGYAPLEQYVFVSKRYAATDFYAFCASMYELLTGQLPIDAIQRDLASADPLIPPRQLNPNISESMEKVILTGLKIKVKDRFQTADELIEALKDNSVAQLVSLESLNSHFILDKDRIIIGRRESADQKIELDLANFSGSDTVSKQHGMMENHQGQWIIQDLHSTNGIFLKRLGQTRFSRLSQPEKLNSGDELAFGKVRFIFKIN